jgi:serine/threonine-protein kinase
MVGQNIGKYRVLDRVGRGGMGTVYRAIDETLHREVAIKVLNAELNDPEVARRFRAEAITVARLSHPGIATIYELFQHDGQWLMVMEFVRGETLERMIERTGAQAAERAAELCMQSLTALAHAHSMGVVHRDLKPANIMLTESGAIKIMDFGIARVAGTEHLTNVGFMMGTPAYMAPEQVLGHEIDARADLYAMGVVFYRLLTAQLPFKGETPFAMAQAQVNNPPTPVGTFRADLPAWVEEVMARSLAKKPDDRFQSAVEFHEGFARSLSGQPMPSAYSSSAPTSLLATPPKAMPTGTIEQTVLSPTPRTGTAAVPAVGVGGTGSVEGHGTAPTIAAATPASLLRPPTGSLTMSATSGLATGGTSGGVPSTPSAAVSTSAPASDLPVAPVPKKGIGVGTIAAVAGLVIVLGGAAFFMLRPGSEAPAQPELQAGVAPPAATPPESVPPPSVVSAAPGPGTGAPAAPAPSTATVAPATPGPAAAAVAGRATDPALVTDSTGRRGDPAARGAAAVSAGRRGAAPVDDELLAFPDVRILVVEGKKARDQEALLNFSGGQIAVVDRRAGTVIATLPYRNVVAATYVRARNPKWNASLISPPADLDVGGVLRTSKHYLTLQTKESYQILRLEDANVLRVLQTVEARTGVTIDRPSSNERN